MKSKKRSPTRAKSENVSGNKSGRQRGEKTGTKLKRHVLSSMNGKKNQREIEPFARVETGIQGLDQILLGGFLKGGTYLVLGAPGTGKTVFANQLSFHQISKGGRAVYVTLLAESHTRMFGNLRPMQFFHPEDVSSKIQYISGYSVLEKEGLDGLLRLLRDLVYQHGANILFIDGVASADELSGSTVQFKKFVHHLNSVLGIAGCTTFLLSSAEGDQTQPEYTMVDGILNLTFCHEGMKTVRELEVRKFRGSPHIYGAHFFEISDKGISVYPRIESIFGFGRSPQINLKQRKAFGLKTLDGLLNGGLIASTTTALLGPAGTGKTQMGMQFLLEGAKNGDAGLCLSLYEHPDWLEANLNSMGKALSAPLKSGMISFLRLNSTQHMIDKLLAEFIVQVREKKIKRAFIDGISGIRTNMLRPGRLVEVMTAFFRELRILGVTVLITEERDVSEPSFEGAVSNHSALIDNIFEFRHVELDGKRIQAFNVLKTRESRLESSIHEMILTDRGIQFGGQIEFIRSYLPVAQRKATESS